MRAIALRSARQSSLVTLAVLTLAIILVAGCGGSDSTSPPPGGQPDVWNVESQRTWTQGADNEGYYCHAEQEWVSCSSDENRSPV